LDGASEESDHRFLGGALSSEAERRVEERRGRPRLASAGDVHGQPVHAGVILDPHGNACIVGRDGDVEADGRAVRSIRPHRSGLDGHEAAGSVAGGGAIVGVGRAVVGEAAEPARAVQRRVAVPEDDERHRCAAAESEAGVEGGLEGGGTAGADAPDVDGAREQQEALGAVELGEEGVLVEEEGRRREDGGVASRHEVLRRGGVEDRVAEGVDVRRRRGGDGDGCCSDDDEEQDKPELYSTGHTIRAWHLVMDKIEWRIAYVDASERGWSCIL